MNFFECCHHCVAPKRHSKCHIDCPEYLEAKERWDVYKLSKMNAKLTEPRISNARKAIIYSYRQGPKNKY